MSLLIKGVTKLSQLAIDVAKNWAAKKIENIGAPDSADDAKRHDSAPAAHKDSHDPIDGGDKLDSAAPVKVGAANAIGSSHSFVRADHVHEREHAKTTAGELNLADMAERAHGSLTGVTSDLHHAQAHKDDHDPIDGGDKLDTAIPVKVAAANAIGSSHSLSRADHVHEREHAIYTHPTVGTCPQAPKAHESTHVSGGSDDIDSALAIAAMANLTNNKIWKGNGGNRPIEIDVPAGGLAIFGDGSDGEGSFETGTVGTPVETPLTRDMFYNNLVIGQYDTVTTAGFRIFVKGTLTNNGTISNIGAYHDSGNSGSLGRGRDGGFTGGDESEGGAGGPVIFIAAKTIINSSGVIKADGNNGRDGDPTPSDQDGDGGDNTTHSLGANGGIGGTATGQTPGAGGTATAPAATEGGFKALPLACILKDIDTTVTKIAGGAGGGSGARSDANSMSGGGGGGGGGLLVLVYNSLTTGTETANGGSGGAGFGGGGTGANGVAGTVVKLVCI